MNIYLLIILVSLIGVWGLNLAANVLNLRALSPQPPEEFAGELDPEKYARSQEYARANIRLDTLTGAVDTGLLIGFILLGGFNAVDLWARGPGLGEIPTGLIFMAALGLLSFILSLPFDIYHTFVLESRFGFNTTSVGTYVMDKIKGLLLAVVIGGVLLTAILWFFRATGAWAWVWCWGFATVLTLFLTYVSPTWILPLFNKFTPMEDGELRTALEEFARQADFDLTGIFVMDGSKRSTKANAFFTGLGRKKRIALFDTLIKNHTTDEIVAVLAHEVGHSKLGHIRKQLITAVAKAGIMFFIMSLFLNNEQLFAAFGMAHVSIYAGLIFFALLYTPVSTVLALAGNKLSRVFEFQADAFAARTTGRAEYMISALKRLSVDSLSNLTPHPLTVVLEYSHPPVVERIRALKTA